MLLARWGQEVGVLETEARRWLRAAFWWTLDAMVPYHATVDLEGLAPRLRRVHEHCVVQVLDAAANLLG